MFVWKWTCQKRVCGKHIFLRNHVFSVTHCDQKRININIKNILPKEYFLLKIFTGKYFPTQ